jgi:hypothetical protein
MSKFVNLLMNAASKEDAWVGQTGPVYIALLTKPKTQSFQDSQTFLELVTEVRASNS